MLFIKQSVLVFTESLWQMIVLIGTFDLSFSCLFVCQCVCVCVCVVSLIYFYSFLAMPILCFLHISIVTYIRGICNCNCSYIDYVFFVCDRSNLAYIRSYIITLCSSEMQLFYVV